MHVNENKTCWKEHRIMSYLKFKDLLDTLIKVLKTYNLTKSMRERWWSGLKWERGVGTREEDSHMGMVDGVVQSISFCPPLVPLTKTSLKTYPQSSNKPTHSPIPFFFCVFVVVGHQYQTLTFCLSNPSYHTLFLSFSDVFDRLYFTRADVVAFSTFRLSSYTIKP